jgi:hypothetical protein
MRKTFGLILIIILCSIISCKNEPNKPIETIEPFELSIGDYNYSMAYSVLYKLTNEKLTITFRGELENEKDSVLFSTSELPINNVRKLSKINIDSLSVLYSNPCISDGDIKSFQFKKNGISKSVTLQNYYHAELSPAIETINELVPEKFQMYFDKKQLIERLERCGDAQIIDSWETYNNAE